MEEFFKKHPEYSNNPVYITGESYAGKYIPYIVTEIHRRKKQVRGKRVNLVGFAIGDGWINPELQTEIQINYAYSTGFIDIKQRESLYEFREHILKLMDKGKWKEAYKADNQFMETLLKYGGNPDIYDVRDFKGIPLDLLTTYLGQDAVKKALNVPTNITWQCADDSGPVAEALAADVMKDASHLLGPIMDAGYRGLFYTGNFDMSCGFEGTEEILYNMEWKKKRGWQQTDRKVWVSSEQETLGFVKEHKNLSQIVIPGSGHMVPMDQPRIAQKMINHFIYNEEFLSYNPEEKNTKKTKNKKYALRH